jgi:hypothetical protein
MTYDGHYTPEEIEEYHHKFYPNAFYSTTSALLCIFLILRYSSNSMKGSYRFHLLNITIWTLLSDLIITLLTQFYSLAPVNGGCYPGLLPTLLMKVFHVSTALHLTIVSYF